MDLGLLNSMQWAVWREDRERARVAQQAKSQADEERHEKNLLALQAPFQRTPIINKLDASAARIMGRVRRFGDM